MLNIRKVILTVIVCMAIPAVVSILGWGVYYLDFMLVNFVKSHFQPGTLPRVRILLPLTIIAGFPLIRFVAIRGKFIDAGKLTMAENFCHLAITKFLPLPLAIAIGLAFAGWFPHYLFWPWWMDLEHFAMSAQMWDSGIRPYRDLIDFNFPGPIYFMWATGKVFGWGRPMVANAIDGLVVALICTLVVAWSRKRLGSATPGLFSAFLIVRYYFSLDYARVMQRDWYVAGLSIAAICLVQMRAVRYRWFVAGVLLALAGCLRPYAILAVAPVMTALWSECEPPRRERLFAMARFLAVLAACTVALWFPLVAHGIFDDFLRTFVDEARRGAYESNKSETLAGLLWRQVDTKIVFTGCVGLLAALVATRGDSARFRLVATWSIAFVAMLFYMPICPVRHAYTEIPLEIFACIASGIGLWVLLESRAVAASVKTVVLIVWFASQFPGWPDYCEFRASGQSLVDLARWREPVGAPPGCRLTLASERQGKTTFHWEEYQEVLRYIRENTDAETRVANFVCFNPFPAFNGPTGRKIVFPCAEGVLWLRWVNPALESRFAEALERGGPCIAVMVGKSKYIRSPCPYPIIDAEIRKRFRYEKTCGQLEIWIRRPGLAGIDDGSIPAKPVNQPAK